MAAGRISAEITATLDDSARPVRKFLDNDVGTFEVSGAIVAGIENRLAIRKDLGPTLRRLPVCQRRHRFWRATGVANTRQSRALPARLENDRPVGRPRAPACFRRLTERHRSAASDRHLFQLPI